VGVQLAYGGTGLLSAPGAPTPVLPMPVAGVQIPTRPSELMQLQLWLNLHLQL